MADPGSDPGEMLNYVNNALTHKGNLKAALDYHSVRDPDLELISTEGRRLFGHRAVLGIFSQMLADVFSYLPCCQKASLMFPDTSSEVLSHLLNVLYTGSTETSSDKVELLCGSGGVFATAKLLGIDIKSDQKVIEVVDRAENSSGAPTFTSIHDESLDIADDTEDDTVVVEGEEAPETMEITPQIPMFDLSHFLYQPPYLEAGEEEHAAGPAQQQENEDYYICKIPNCRTMIQFENCGARSKILNHYTSHFQKELEHAYGHLLSEEMQCTLCGKNLQGFIKSKVWIHIGVTHDKTNEILMKKGIDPVRVNIRNKRKASDAFREETSPTVEENIFPVSRLPIDHHPTYNQQLATPGQIKSNTCKICGQVTQNRKRLLKHYCTKHFIDRLSLMEFSFIEKNQCVVCHKDFLGAKKSSKVIHIGLEHRKIYEILDEEFGKDGYLKHDSSTPIAPPPLKKIRAEPPLRPIAPKVKVPSPPVVADRGMQVVHPGTMGHVPRVEASMSERMKEIQDLGNTCHVCGKQFDLFRSMLLPHYCGHFYKEIAQGHEDYFTEVNCKLCGATATKRKSRIIHLGVKHELVLPFINDVLKSRNLLPSEEDTEDAHDDSQNEFVIDESEIKSDVEEGGEEANVEHAQVNNAEDQTDVTEDELSDLPKSEPEPDEPEAKVVTPIRIKTVKMFKEEEDSGTDLSQDGMTICKIVKDDEKVEPLDPAPVCKLQNNKVWDTPTQAKGEVLTKWAIQQNNVDNQDKPYHLDTLFNASEGVEEQKDELPLDEEHEVEEEAIVVDEVTADNLGLVCKLCGVTEAADHELLTHYCSHFDTELKEISSRMIDEDHKCVECHKMLGNNKRRLYHFGVKHLKVIPLINQKLRAAKVAQKRLDDSADMTEEDDFEITYDKVEGDAATSSSQARGPEAGGSSCSGKVAAAAAGGHKNPRLCELCGCKRNTSFNLLLHCTKQHFLEQIRCRWGHHVPGHTCQLCGDRVDTNTKNGDADKWIHLGHKHGKTNQLLREQGKRMIIIKGYNDQDVALENSTENVPVETSNQTPGPGPECFPSSEDEICSSPPKETSLPSPVITEYNCPLCEKTTKNQNLLDLHLIAIHFKKELLQNYGNPENTCEICNKTFNNVDAFAFHIGKDHDLLKVVMQKGLGLETNSNDCDSSHEAECLVTKPFVLDTKPSPQSPEDLSSTTTNFSCFKCGAKRRGMKELYGHYSLQHFSTELKQEFGVQKQCTFEDCEKSLENGTAWISHLGQEHPEVLNQHIPKEYWQHTTDDAKSIEIDNAAKMFKCPLKCSSSFSDRQELLSHFKSVHGFSNEIITKVLRAHPQLGGGLDGGIQHHGAKKIEA